MKLFHNKTNFRIFQYKNIIFGSIFICFSFFMVLFSSCTHKKIKIKSELEMKWNQRKREIERKKEREEKANNKIRERNSKWLCPRQILFYYSTWMTKAVIISICVVVRRLSHFTFDFYFILFFVHSLPTWPSSLALCITFERVSCAYTASWHIPLHTSVDVTILFYSFFSEKASVTTTTTGQTSKQSRMMRMCFLLTRDQILSSVLIHSDTHIHSWSLQCFDFVLSSKPFGVFFFCLVVCIKNSLFTTHNSCSMRKQPNSNRTWSVSLLLQFFFFHLFAPFRQPFICRSLFWPAFM